MALEWIKLAADVLVKAASAPGNIVTSVYEGLFPHVQDGMGARQDVELVSAKIFKVEVGSDPYVVVVLCRKAEDGFEWSYYCGDGQVAGSFPNDGKTLAAQLRKEGVVAQTYINHLEESPWVGIVSSPNTCAFFQMQKRGLICSHTKAVLQHLTVDDLEAMKAPLESALSGKAPPVAPRKRSPEEEAALRVAFVKPLLLAGERGSGKTFFARQLANDLDAVYLEIQVHPSMEPWELRMHDRACNGKIYSVMGKLAEAVYWIQQGKRVVLCLDEFLNMNPVYQTVINSPLSLTENDTYLIETGRVIDMGDGLGRVETVEVPRDMLWVVATTNIGARYGLEKIAPSVRARFRIVLMNTNADRTVSIVEQNLVKAGMPVQLADMFRKFIEACNQAVQESVLDEEATTRLACDVIRAAKLNVERTGRKLTSVKQWVAEVRMHLMDEITQVVNFELGPLDPDQKLRYESTVNACFKAK